MLIDSKDGRISETRHKNQNHLSNTCLHGSRTQGQFYSSRGRGERKKYQWIRRSKKEKTSTAKKQTNKHMQERMNSCVVGAMPAKVRGLYHQKCSPWNSQYIQVPKMLGFSVLDVLETKQNRTKQKHIYRRFYICPYLNSSYSSQL